MNGSNVLDSLNSYSDSSYNDSWDKEQYSDDWQDNYESRNGGSDDDD